MDYLCGSNEPQNLSTEDAGLQIGHLKAIRRNHWRTYTAQNKIMYAIENFLKNHVPSNSSVDPEYHQCEFLYRCSFKIKKKSFIDHIVASSSKRDDNKSITVHSNITFH